MDRNPETETTDSDPRLQRDLATLARFIDFYCRRRHRLAPRSPVRIKTHDVDAMVRKPLELCSSCRKLLAHAFVKRMRCPLSPKPACKHCSSHCYHPNYRRDIQRVMKFSGPRLVLSGGLDYLRHLLT